MGSVGALNGVLVPGKPHEPAPPVKDDGDQIDARVLRQVFIFVFLPIHLNETGKSIGLGRSNGLLRSANVGRGATSHFDGHKRPVDNADDIEFSGTVADVFGQSVKTLGFKTA